MSLSQSLHLSHLFTNRYTLNWFLLLVDRLLKNDFLLMSLFSMLLVLMTVNFLSFLGMQILNLQKRLLFLEHIVGWSLNIELRLMLNFGNNLFPKSLNEHLLTLISLFGWNLLLNFFGFIFLFLLLLKLLWTMGKGLHKLLALKDVSLEIFNWFQ